MSENNKPTPKARKTKPAAPRRRPAGHADALRSALRSWLHRVRSEMHAVSDLLVYTDRFAGCYPAARLQALGVALDHAELELLRCMPKDTPAELAPFLATDPEGDPC